MSYDSMLESLLTVAIGMNTGNVSECLDALSNAEQSRARSACRLPKEMKPSKDVFETLGFTFEDYGDDVLYKVTLPEGWTLKPDSRYRTIIIDEKGRERGKSVYKGTFYDRYGHMHLISRFRVTHEPINPENCNSPIKVCAKCSDGTILFEAGQCKESCINEYKELIGKATDYLKTNYPEWEDASKYWD